MAKYLLKTLLASLFFLSIQPCFAHYLVNRVNRSIFTIISVNTDGNESVTLGNAIAIKKNILAANCRIAMAGNFVITNVDNRLIVSSITYHKGDLCLISVPGVVFQPVRVRPTNSIKVGEQVFTIGNQNGFRTLISSGVIAKKIQSQNTQILQTNKAMNLGYNGSGLFDADGNLIGITTIKHTDKKDTGTTLPTELILAMIPPEQIVTAVKSSNNTKSYVELTNATQQYVVSRYGKSGVNLINQGENCMIGIVGRDKDNNPRSIAFWRDESPNSFVVFPFTPDPNRAVDVLNQYLQNKSFVLKPADSFLLIDNTLYELFGEAKKDTNFPLLITEVNKNPTAQLMTSTSFKVQMKDPVEGMITLHYDLLGFSEALAAYKSYCGRS